jgi:pimeloyl-ACP methyl ester carboxylesterase
LILAVGSLIYAEEVRARFDLVGFDPRGIGRSTGLRCFGTPGQWDPLAPFPFPITSEEESIWESADRYLVENCDKRGFKIIDHMSTADVARDLDLLRQTVGDEQLSYVGVSYGTYLGATYVNLFPDKVRAVVLDSVLDPIAWSTGGPGEGSTVPSFTRLHSAAGARDTLNEFFRLCDAGENCPFSPNSASRFDALTTKLRSDPLVIAMPDGTTFTFTYADLISVTLGVLYNSYAWPDLAALLAAIEGLASPAELGARLNALEQSMGFINKRGFPHYPNLVEGFAAVSCADTDNPDTFAVWSDAAASAEAQEGYFGPLWTWVSSVCSTWSGSQADRYIGPFDQLTANPVLLVNTLYDPATRYEGAVALNNLLPNSRLLTVKGWGHGTPMLSWEADQAVSQYLLDGTLPPEGTVFQQDYVPFAGAGGGMAAGSASSAIRTELVPFMVLEPVRKSLHIK